MMASEVGIVVEKIKLEPKGLIATSTGFISFIPDNEIGFFDVGDWVTFTVSLDSNRSTLATVLTQANASPVKSSIHEDKSVHLQCKVEQLIEIAGDQKIIRTNFIRTIRVMGEQIQLCTQALIGKTINLKYNPSKKEFEILNLGEEENEKITLIGFAYAVRSNPNGTRVYVPKYKEDFILPKNIQIGSWIQFTINTKTGDLGLRSIKVAKDRFDTRKTSLKLTCHKIGNSFTTEFGDPIIDKHNELNKREYFGDFEAELWIELVPMYPRNAKFVLSQHQLNPRFIPISQSAVNSPHHFTPPSPPHRTRSHYDMNEYRNTSNQSESRQNRFEQRNYPSRYSTSNCFNRNTTNDNQSLRGSQNGRVGSFPPIPAQRPLQRKNSLQSTKMNQHRIAIRPDLIRFHQLEEMRELEISHLHLFECPLRRTEKDKEIERFLLPYKSK
uniref:Arrestin_N domain-containing protein n=1 Tax=Caenorhabditis tropicalis TaxID=1561998 RepID=A0A1I7T0K6_9PELO